MCIRGLLHTGLILHHNLLNGPVDTSQLSSVLQLSIHLTIINNTAIYMRLNWGLIWFKSWYGNSLAGWQWRYTWREFNLNPPREALRRWGGVEMKVLKTRECIVPHLTFTYTCKVALYGSRRVVIKLWSAMLLGVVKLTDLDRRRGMGWGLALRFGLFCVHGSSLAHDREGVNGFSHTLGSHSYGIKMRTLFECQRFSWMLKWHSAISHKVCSVK